MPSPVLHEVQRLPEVATVLYRVQSFKDCYLDCEYWHTFQASLSALCCHEQVSAQGVLFWYALTENGFRSPT